MNKDQIFETWNLTLIPGQDSDQGGNLNNILFVQDADCRPLCLRFVKEQARDGLEPYLSGIYEAMGVFTRGGKFRYRDVGEQVETMAALARDGIPVPAVIDHGSDWLLMETATGQTLKDILSSADPMEARTAIRKTLCALMDAHRKGHCLWDRWGANEFIDGNSITFIDFDIELSWPDTVPFNVRTAFDLSYLIRGCILLSKDQEVAGHAVAQALLLNPAFDKLYDPKALNEFLRGQITYGENLYVSGTGVDQAVSALHSAANFQIRTVMDAIEHKMVPEHTDFSLAAAGRGKEDLLPAPKNCDFYPQLNMPRPSAL